MSVYDVPADKLINAVANDLKENIKFEKPNWANFVKTGVSRERAPDKEDWWWVRTASILRKLYIRRKAVGVNRLRTAYGGRKNRGVMPEHFYKGSGKIIRTILQKLDAIGFTEKTDKGRIISPKGISYLDKISKNIK